MKKLMNILFLSCLKASEMIEKKLHFKLNITEKLQLSMHKTMCSACSLYEKQSELLEKGISESLNQKHPHANTEHLKEKILNDILK